MWVEKPINTFPFINSYPVVSTQCRTRHRMHGEYTSRIVKTEKTKNQKATKKSLFVLCFKWKFKVVNLDEWENMLTGYCSLMVGWYTYTKMWWTGVCLSIQFTKHSLLIHWGWVICNTSTMEWILEVLLFPVFLSQSIFLIIIAYKTIHRLDRLEFHAPPNTPPNNE